MNPETLLQPHIRGLAPYLPIVPFEVLSRRAGPRACRRCSSLTPTKTLTARCPPCSKRCATTPGTTFTPTPAHTELREALGSDLGLPAELILPTHGADEMIDLLCRLFAGPGDSILNCPPTFGMYEFDASLQGAQVIAFPRRPDFAVDVDAIERHAVAAAATSASLRPRFYFSPRPTIHRETCSPIATCSGSLRSRSLSSSTKPISSLPTCLAVRRGCSNTTTSSSCALSARRRGSQGCASATESAPHGSCRTSMTFKQPYNVNVAATAAGLATLRHKAEVRRGGGTPQADSRPPVRHCSLQFPGSIPIRRTPTSSCATSSAGTRDSVKQALEARGILVRHYDKPGLRNCIRISVGTEESIARLAFEFAALE